MLENVGLGFHLLLESIAEGKLIHLFRQQVFRSRLITPVVMDLTMLDPAQDPLRGTECSFIELDLDQIRAGKYSFAVKSRRYKAFRNIRRGMRGFALVKDGRVLGDLWCLAPREKGRRVQHPDLDMLKIICAEGEAYAQDMLIDPAYRGKNLAVPLLRSLHLELKKEGWRKVYGCFWDDNIPAMWMHRMLKFKELPKCRVSRFFRWIRSESQPQPGLSADYAENCSQ